MTATMKPLEEDYNALFALMKRDIPKVWLEIFPEILAQLEMMSAFIITSSRLSASALRVWDGRWASSSINNRSANGGRLTVSECGWR